MANPSVESTDNQPLAYTIERALELLPHSRSRFYKDIGSGDVRTFKCGKRRFVTRAALIEYVDRLESGVAA